MCWGQLGTLQLTVEVGCLGRTEQQEEASAECRNEASGDLNSFSSAKLIDLGFRIEITYIHVVSWQCDVVNVKEEGKKGALVRFPFVKGKDYVKS